MKECYFAGGCFWCIESVFDVLNGVKEVTSGYSGGDEANPTYLEVKKQLTSHRETIKVIYDENVISYNELVDIFIDNVDPFDNEGQFIDKGHSYTLAIYYLNEEEYSIAKEKINKLEKESNKKVFISLEKYKSFYDAEEEHQDYYKNRPEEFNKELLESGRKKEA